MQDIKIHFICRGNVFRGRLAEMYAKSLDASSVQFSSSGIDAEKYYPKGKHLSSQAAYIVEKYHLSIRDSPKQKQTTDAMLRHNDILVFLSTDVYTETQARFTLNLHKCVVWDITDWDAAVAKPHADTHDVASTEMLAIELFEKIRHKLTRLLARCKESSWVDMVDQTDKPLGFRLPISWACKQGLWYRGCHALIVTADRKCIVEKRSSRIMFAPGYLDISLGGGVDSGETPERAMIRETKEELGLVITPKMLRLMTVHKWHSYHPRYRTHTNAFIYTYYVALPATRPALTLQKDEVARAWFLSAPMLRRLLRRHRLRRFGRLRPAYAYYAKIVRLAEEIEAPSTQS